MIGNRPRRPRDNAVVERSQGVGKQWTEPQTCDSAEELQQRLGQADRWQRENYPRSKGRSRRQAYPGLQQSGRRYRRAWETKHWSPKAVRECLAGSAVPRQVDQSGKVALYNRGHYVGHRQAGRTVWVTLDAATGEWIRPGMSRSSVPRC
jgi:hypothetical protein